jgi:hypothetical protein
LRRENKRLQMERDMPKKAALIFGATSRSSSSSSMSIVWPVRVMCPALGLSMSGYYA